MIYLDNAATSFPKPERVVRAVSDCLSNYCGNPGRAGHSLSLKAAEKVYSVRESIAEMLGGEPERVVFTKNATEALSLAIKSFAKPNSHILISSLEHNSVLRCVDSLSESKITYDVFPIFQNPIDTVAAIKRRLKPETSLIVSVHRSNIAPIRVPVELIGELCRKNGIRLVVDASQSAGIEEIKIEKIGASAICAPGHKSLYGVQGSGFALFSKAVRDDEVLPLYVGGSGTNSLSLRMPDSLPERAEAGTLSLPAIAGLGEGVRFVKEIGERELMEHESALIKRLARALEGSRHIIPILPYKTEGNVFSFNVDSLDSEYVASELDKSGICVRGGIHCAPLAHSFVGTKEKGAVRISVGAFNTVNDINCLLKILYGIVKGS